MTPANDAAPLGLRDALAISCAIEDQPRAVAYDPDARAFEAFGFGARGTSLLDPLLATTLDGALAEVTEREHLDRGDRIGVREIGQECDLLHIYAVRRTDTVTSYRRAYDNPCSRTPLTYKRRLDHICTVDLQAVAGIPPARFSDNPSLDRRYRQEDAHRQAQRPEGARR